MADRPMPLKRHRTIERILQVLELAASAARGLTLTEIARSLHAPVSSIQGIVDGLVATGFLDRTNKRYMLGPASYVLTLRGNRMPARTIKHDDLEEMHRKCGVSVLLGIRVGRHVVYIDEVGDVPHLVYLAKLRMRRPLLETVAGQLLLSAMSEEDLHEYLSSHDDRQLVDDYLGRLTSIRATLVAVTRASVFSKGTVAGCLVRDSQGHGVAAIVVGDATVWGDERIAEVSEYLRQKSALWSRRATGNT